MTDDAVSSANPKNGSNLNYLPKPKTLQASVFFKDNKGDRIKCSVSLITLQYIWGNPKRITAKLLTSLLQGLGTRSLGNDGNDTAD